MSQTEFVVANEYAWVIAQVAQWWYTRIACKICVRYGTGRSVAKGGQVNHLTRD